MSDVQRICPQCGGSSGLQMAHCPHCGFDMQAGVPMRQESFFARRIDESSVAGTRRRRKPGSPRRLEAAPKSHDGSSGPAGSEPSRHTADDQNRFSVMIFLSSAPSAPSASGPRGQ